MPLFLVLVTGLLAAVSAPAADGEGTNSTLAKVEGAVEHGAHAAASGVERGVHAVARGIKHGAKATARGIDRGAHAAARGVKHGAEATGKAVHKVANKVEGSSDASSASRPAK